MSAEEFEELIRPYREGVVIDLGTGDGRFVSTAAKASPNKFFIGIDANTKPLEKPSMRATRKPAKGGLKNALFVKAAVEDLRAEFDGIADEIHIHFPWGSLLRAVALPEPVHLASLRRIAAPDCLLEVVIGIDPERDRAEIDRLGIPPFTTRHISEILLPAYRTAGFRSLCVGKLDATEWRQLETSWARRLRSDTDRSATALTFRAI